jgi:hypothetical protein
MPLTPNISSYSTGGASSGSVSHNNTGGGTLLGFVSKKSGNTGVVVSGMTYNASAMTIEQGAASSRASGYVFKHETPATGPNTFAAQLSVSSQHYGFCINVPDTGTILQSSIRNGPATSYTRTLTGTQTDSICLAFLSIENPATIAETTGATVEAAPASWAQIFSHPGNGGSVTFTVTNSANRDAQLIALELSFVPPVSFISRETFFFSMAGLAIPAAMGKIVVPAAEQIEKLI